MFTLMAECNSPQDRTQCCAYGSSSAREAPVVERYYPFGLGMKGLDYVAPSPNKENKFTFNGKEKQTEFGLNHYDFGARGFDYQINRTTTLNPHADRYVNVSPYSFLNNNPLRFIDPTGMDVEDGFNEDGTLHRGTAYEQMKEKDG